MEPPGKDSARFRQAGAHEVMVASPYRYAIVHELRGGPEPTLAQRLERLAPADLVLVEGFKLRPPSRASRSTGRRWASRRCTRRTPASWPWSRTRAGNDARCDAAMPAAERAGRGGGVHLPHTGAGAGESLGFPRRAGQDQSVTGRRRTTLAPCRPGKQDIHDPYRFQNRPRRPAVTPASPVHAHHRHLAGRVGGGAVRRSAGRCGCPGSWKARARPSTIPAACACAPTGWRWS